MKKVGICYFRSLYSQSACSLSVGKLSDYLLNRGYETHLYLLKNDSLNILSQNINKILENDIIIYKTNYKDFEYGIRLFKNLLKNKNKEFYLVGPFASVNKKSILEKYSFIKDIIDIQNNNEVDKYFIDLGEKTNKETIISGIDREIEYQEKGRYINLEASTGCIYNCAFCHIKLMNYSKSEKDITLLVSEIDQLVNKMGKKYLIFNDSVFWKNKKDDERIKEFIRQIKERNIKFSFMIYLSLTIKISDELLKELKEIGLIRVFFGVENISNEFIQHNNKYTSAQDTEDFINKLKELNISYHIGFILFSPYTKYDELEENITFLHKIKKLFRPGILIEKMRILPNAKDSELLYKDESKIDQAYNYKILDDKVDKYYYTLNKLFENINIRNFEQFFSGINIAITLLKDQKQEINYHDEIISYNKTLDTINDEIYKILIEELETLDVSNKNVEDLKDLYSIAEANYINFMNKLNNKNRMIFETIPHGCEDLNVW